MSDSLQPHESQHARPPCPSPTPGVHWDSRPSSRWCHLAISSSVVPFSSCPQSLPASALMVESIFLASNKWKFLSLYILLSLVLGWEVSLEEGMATHSSIVARRIPWESSLAGHKESDTTEVTRRACLVQSVSLTSPTLVGVHWYVIVVLIILPWWLMGRKTYLYLLVTWIVSFVKCLLKVLLFLINLWEYYAFSGYKLFVIYTCVANILSHFMICIFKSHDDVFDWAEVPNYNTVCQ